MKKTNELRDRHFFVPLTDEEVKGIAEAKRLTGISKAHFVRNAILAALDKEAWK